MEDCELLAETEERRNKGTIILLSKLARQGVSKGEEIKMQRSRAGSSHYYCWL